MVMKKFGDIFGQRSNTIESGTVDWDWREKKSKHFVFYKHFYLILGLLKSKISKLLGRKPDFKLFKKINFSQKGHSK